MKKILASFVALLAALAVTGYGTYALWSDTETSTGNTITAGSLDLVVPEVFLSVAAATADFDGDGTTDYTTEVYPGVGYSGTADGPQADSMISLTDDISTHGTYNGDGMGPKNYDYVPVTNNGTIDGELTVEIGTVTDGENGRTSAELAAGDDAGNGELSPYVEVRFHIDVDGDENYEATTSWKNVTTGTFWDFGGAADIAAGETARLMMEYRVDSAAGNDTMTDTVDFELIYDFQQI
jgi:predicted ribosomally synthesized peptide with SipW-like signal peptide